MKRKTVLLVDDDKIYVDIIADILVERGFLVLKAYNGFDAFQTIEKIEVDLILLDIVMPEFDGLEFCKVTKKMTPSTAVLIVSGQESDSEIKMAQKCGVDEFITKPYEINFLVERIQHYLK